MTGFEYSTAIHMLYEGQTESGVKVYEAIRHRFDGKKRNPFNEGEFGHRYARAMAAWAGVIAWTGFEYSGVTKTMKFNPLSGDGTYFWSNGYAFGTVNFDYSEVSLEVLGGKLILSEFQYESDKKSNFKKEPTLNEGDDISFSVK